MLSKCANPACSARFRYLHEGRIFNLQFPQHAPGSQESRPRVEHYWLCTPCSRTLKVVA